MNNVNPLPPFEHAHVFCLDEKNKTSCSTYFFCVFATVIMKVWMYVVHIGFKDVVNANSAWCGGVI